MRHKIVSQSALVVAALGLMVSVSTDAHAQDGVITQTGLQNNGIECVLDSSYSSGLWRDWQGVRNSSSDHIMVSCPLTQSSADSYGLALQIRNVELHYGGDAPSCLLSFKDVNGGHYFSPDFVPGTSATSGTSVMKLDGPYRIGAAEGAINVTIQCVLPAGTLIFGSTAVKEVERITGGI